MADEKTIPTWGYHKTEPARIFNLREGEKLPKGWQDSPVKAEPVEEKKDDTEE